MCALWLLDKLLLLPGPPLMADTFPVVGLMTELLGEQTQYISPPQATHGVVELALPATTSTIHNRTEKTYLNFSIVYEQMLVMTMESMSLF